MKSLSQEEFDSILKKFNSLLIEYLNVPISHNYIKDSAAGKYIYSNVETKEGLVVFTVSYDKFYQVPVLFFQKNGQLKPSANCVVDIHPILQSPYLMVHPCETKTLMEELDCKDPLDFLMCWFGTHIEQISTEIQLRVPKVRGTHNKTDTE